MALQEKLPTSISEISPHVHEIYKERVDSFNDKIRSVYASDEVRDELLALFLEDRSLQKQIRNKLTGEVNIRKGDYNFQLFPIQSGVARIRVSLVDENGEPHPFRSTNISVTKLNVRVSEDQGFGMQGPRMREYGGMQAIDKAEEVFSRFTPNPSEIDA